MTAPLRPSRRTMAGAMALGLAGCARLFVAPPPQYIFRLTPAGTFPAMPHLRTQLQVDTPTTSEALDRRRIALTRSQNLLDYFADAEWSDTVSALVQTVLVNSFENSQAITTINGSLGLRADFLLSTEIRHFEAQYDAGSGPPNVWVSIGAKLVALPAREIVAQAFFDRRVPAGGNDLPSIVAAFDAALREVATEIVVWAVTNAALPRKRHAL
jgi:cholesterol transport system auxiliary component